MGQRTKNSRDIRASAGKIYQALIDPVTLVKWQVPNVSAQYWAGLQLSYDLYQARQLEHI